VRRASKRVMKNARVLTDGLRFPEGPVAMDDGSVIVTELIGKKLTRVAPDGTKTTVADTGGSPNGLAVGPDGALYCTNSGGFAFQEVGPFLIPAGDKGQSQPDDYIGGRIQRIDIESGKVEDLYTECNGIPLKGPNDIVFDASGGFWFTDNGKGTPRQRSVTGVFYATTDGSSCREVIFPLDNPNGVGISPDGRTLYVSETPPARLWAYEISAPGKVALQPGLRGMSGRFVYSTPGVAAYDSLAMEACGNICIATIGHAGITVIASDGALVEHVPTDDPFTTNIAFGGPDLQTAYVTLGGTGRLVKRRWPRPGLALAA